MFQIRMILLISAMMVSHQVGLAAPESGQKIIVAAEGSLSVDAGLEIAKMGGNIVDVAVATAFAMAVELPQSGSLGGGGFAVLYLDGKSYALDYREMAIKAMSPEYYLEKKKDASLTGPFAVGVPGVVAGLHALHEKYGKLKWHKLFQPALTLAEEGFTVNTEMHEALTKHLKRFSEKGKSLLSKDDKPLKPGDLIKQPQLASVLRRIRSVGPSGFYKGEVGSDIVETLQSLGGEMTKEDLENYKVRWLEPIEIDFRGHKVYSMPPPSSGGIVLASALKLTDMMKLDNYPPQSGLEAHLMIEILSRSFRGRSFLADPDFHKNPTEFLLSDTYLEGMTKSINLGEAVSLPPLKEIPNVDIKPKAETMSEESSETTHLSVIDEKGNAIAITTTLNGNFGSGVFTNRFGISLNNEMDDFTTRPGEPNMFGLIQGEGNSVEAGKRPLSSMTPTVAVKDGKAVLALGARGGPRIISAVYQVLYRFLVNGYNLDRSIQIPRVHHQFAPNIVMHDEDRFSPDTLKVLKARGHKLKEKNVAGVFAVGRKEDLLYGAFDSRGHGKASGY